MSPRLRPLLLGLFTLTLTACDSQNQTEQKVPEMPRFDGPELANGRSTWMGTCRNCHLLGVSGAPAVTDFPAWEPRIAKGKEQLYQSALNGVRDAEGKIRMPPRGGNNRLSEEQVKRAVDYMVAAVGHFHQNP